MANTALYKGNIYSEIDDNPVLEEGLLEIKKYFDSIDLNYINISKEEITLGGYCRWNCIHSFKTDELINLIQKYNLIAEFRSTDVDDIGSNTSQLYIDSNGVKEETLKLTDF